MYESPSGKRYIGKTIQKDIRHRQHAHAYGSSPYFHNAIRKHGWENFSYQILEEFDDDVTEEFMSGRETHWIEVYASNNPTFGYNLTLGGEGVPGRKWTEEQRQAHGKTMTRNHSVKGGGCIFFKKQEKKWSVISKKSKGKKGKMVGSYYTRETAAKALHLYNTTGVRLQSDVKMRKSGTGTIAQQSNGRFTGSYYKCGRRVSAGTYDTYEEAEAAIRNRKTTKRRRPGTGGITKTKCGRFIGMYTDKCGRRVSAGTYDTYEEADQALLKHIENI